MRWAAGLEWRAFAVVLALTWSVGAILLPLAEEPGTSERNGIVLNMLVDRGDGPRPNDWYSASPTASVHVYGEELRAESLEDGYLLVSRPLPTFASSCYGLTAAARSRIGSASIVVFDDDLAMRIGELAIPESAKPELLEARISTGPYRRLSLLLTASSSDVVQIRLVELKLLARSPCSSLSAFWAS